MTNFLKVSHSVRYYRISVLTCLLLLIVILTSPSILEPVLAQNEDESLLQFSLAITFEGVDDIDLIVTATNRGDVAVNNYVVRLFLTEGLTLADNHQPHDFYDPVLAFEINVAPGDSTTIIVPLYVLESAIIEGCLLVKAASLDAVARLQISLVSELQFSLAITSEGVKPSDDIDLIVTATNRGDVAVNNYVVRLFLTEGLTLADNHQPHDLYDPVLVFEINVAPGDSITIITPLYVLESASTLEGCLLEKATTRDIVARLQIPLAGGVASDGDDRVSTATTTLNDGNSTLPHVTGTINQSGADDVRLSWMHETQNLTYHVWHNGISPYFTPGDSGSNELTALIAPASSEYFHSDALADSENGYYVIVVENGLGEYVSNRMGEFNFDLMSGLP